VPETTVLIYAMPRLLDDILGSLVAGEPDVTVVHVAAGPESIAEVAARADADVVVAVERDAGPAAVSDLLQRVPHAQALTVSDDARTGVVYELRPHRKEIELSDDSVRSAIQRARRRHEPFFEPRPAP
jgi:DNA-binding NarL/FixJ family response regulator